MFTIETFDSEGNKLFRVACQPGNAVAFQYMQRFTRDYDVSRQHENGWLLVLSDSQFVDFIADMPTADA